MAEYRIDISSPAKADIREIAAYIANELKEPEIAENYVNLIIEAIYSLEHVPARIPTVHDDMLAAEGVRGLRIRNYTVFFTINEAEQSVTVVRVMYMRRNWPDLLQPS